MREIRFRGKRVDTGEWVYGYPVKHVCATGSMWAIHTPPVDPDDSAHVYEVIPKTVGQYTGLKDKNGVEIYKGDVVKYENEQEKGVAIVERFFNTSNLYFKWIEQETPHPAIVSNIDHVACEKENEVIGNIHDKAVK